MYFPFFRGRQYELLALRELANRRLISSSVIPVIEPVKLIPAFDSSLKAFNDTGLSVALILNPSVGDLTDAPDTIKQLFNRIGTDTTAIPSLLLGESARSVLNELSDKNISTLNVLAVMDSRDHLRDYQVLFDNEKPKYTLCPDERQIRRAVSQNKVLFEDKFNKQNRNADYPDDEFFSDDHLFYKDDNYIGFGDYSIIGNEYVDSGFAPYAVAIHIVYFSGDNSLRIRHFISDSNDDISDVAGKFYEAVTKLAQWYNDGQERQITTGLSILLEHYNNRTYPGLPTLKKLSIMHHLELMGKYLDRGFGT